MCTVYWYYQPDDENLLEVSTCVAYSLVLRYDG